jgi:hypothetical protein
VREAEVVLLDRLVDDECDVDCKSGLLSTRYYLLGYRHPAAPMGVRVVVVG